MPLAHLLAPLIQRRAEEIEAQLAPSYLQSQAAPAGRAGYEKTPFDPRGLLNKPATKDYDPRALKPEVAMLMRMQNSGNPVLKAAALQQLYNMNVRRDPALLPTAPPVLGPADPISSPDVVGMREDGTPIYASDGAAAPAGRRGRVVLAAGDAEGINERGQNVNRRGRVIGDARAQEDPSVMTKGGKRAMRTGERRLVDPRGADIVISRDGLIYADPGAASALQALYGKDLKAMQDNRDAAGMPTDEFPSGYFNGMPAQTVTNVKRGVSALQQLEKGHRI